MDWSKSNRSKEESGRISGQNCTVFCLKGPVIRPVIFSHFF
jgi:hypothetical protein